MQPPTNAGHFAKAGQFAGSPDQQWASQGAQGQSRPWDRQPPQQEQGGDSWGKPANQWNSSQPEKDQWGKPQWQGKDNQEQWSKGQWNDSDQTQDQWNDPPPEPKAMPGKGLIRKGVGKGKFDESIQPRGAWGGRDDGSDSDGYGDGAPSSKAPPMMSPPMMAPPTMSPPMTVPPSDGRPKQPGHPPGIGQSPKSGSTVLMSPRPKQPSSIPPHMRQGNEGEQWGHGGFNNSSWNQDESNSGPPGLASPSSKAGAGRAPAKLPWLRDQDGGPRPPNTPPPSMRQPPGMSPDNDEFEDDDWNDGFGKEWGLDSDDEDDEDEEDDWSHLAAFGSDPQEGKADEKPQWSQEEWDQWKMEQNTKWNQEMEQRIIPAAKIPAGKAEIKDKCEKGHPLIQWLSPPSGCGCDSCGQTCGGGVVMWGCRKCDFDKCEQCVGKAMPIKPIAKGRGRGRGQQDDNDWKWNAKGKGKGKGKKGKDKGKERGNGKKSKKERKDRKWTGKVPEMFDDENWEEPRKQTELALIGEMAPKSAKWTYPVKDESRRSYVGFLKCPFRTDQCKTFFETVKNGTDWKQPLNPNGTPVPRKTAWMVKKGCNCVYRYGTSEVSPQEYPPWMLDLLKNVMPLCGANSPADWPDSCNMNLYEDGAMSVGWHADDEQLFQGKHRDIAIISLSFGQTRKFNVRLNHPQQGEKSDYTLLLGNGDLCTMEGMTQKHCQHQVPKESVPDRPRINLTWRWIMKHNPSCPATRKGRH